MQIRGIGDKSGRLVVYNEQAFASTGEWAGRWRYFGQRSRKNLQRFLQKGLRFN